MAKRKTKCIICGKVEETKRIKLPHGSFHLCDDWDCRQKLFYGVDGGFPLVRFSMDDFVNHDEATAVIANPLLKDFEVAKELAKEVEDYIWGGQTLGDIFHDALDDALGTLEERYVERLKPEDLPLADMESLKTDKGKQALEQRLKKGQ